MTKKFKEGDVVRYRMPRNMHNGSQGYNIPQGMCRVVEAVVDGPVARSEAFWQGQCYWLIPTGQAPEAALEKIDKTEDQFWAERLPTKRAKSPR